MDFISCRLAVALEAIESEYEEKGKIYNEFSRLDTMGHFVCEFISNCHFGVHGGAQQQILFWSQYNIYKSVDRCDALRTKDWRSRKLSTVSTMVKESVLLTEDHPGKANSRYYSIITCVSCCLLGLMVYATTIRINSENS